MTRGGRRTWTIAATALALALGAVAPVIAGGEELTRDDYVARLETVCKPGAEETQQVMKGARKDVRYGRIPVAAHKFERGAAIFGHTVETIAKVPRPAADTERLEQWFVYLNRQQDYMGQIATELRAERTIKAQRLLARFIHNGNLANFETLAFEFDYCSFKFSRYG